MNIKMTSIPVTDPIKAFKFYTEKLGFQENMYMPEAQLAIVVSKDAPNGTALLLEPSEGTFYQEFQETAREKGLPIIVFGVKNVQDEYDRLKALGVEFKTPPTTNDWGTTVVLDDTVGNYVQLFQE